ncbi:YqgE/AlgH family protein [Flammeovirga kamogawensis]|uniref:YqgE/AlgH family protein n=1 Tax=Flammeovirga kamogawensis TaxID=373891 RepID=A0ABX8GYG2_9BACT|nr:YqgE/AlgH family protein [Flammeovirga kamogawensis]MBB6459084.1 putative transcriptional regulator [Flammeovirga kamogawensis]QWG08653.1 YqgE/AlgH family protein [Flammeovirga kamogawensis]TRX66946.1 YqgE/AlgH family protein [Flammeovirga kamogawensis]
MDFSINFGQRPIESGDLLLSEPFLKDQHFGRAVILMCQHDEEKGSFGLIINKPSMVTIEEVESRLSIDSPIYVGGPVEQDTLHYIHKFKDITNTVPLKDGLYWGGNYEEIQALNAQGKLTDTNCRFFMGYAGWTDHQLRTELKENSWVVSNARLKGILEQPADDLWKETLQEMGGKYKVFANAAKNLRLN